MNLHLILALVYSLKFDESNKVHGQLFRCFDNTIKDLGVLIGNCVRVRSSGLPASYDAIVMMSYFSFFGIAAVVWGVGVGWMSPVIILSASLVVMFLIVMGTKLVRSPTYSFSMIWYVLCL